MILKHVAKARHLAAATALALAALSGTQADARTVEEAKASGSIRVGIQGDNCPWGCINSAGEADGYDAAMGRAFAEYLGVEAEFVPLAVANRIPALATDKVDVLFATMAMNPERAQSIQFSVPYAANQLSLVGPKDADLSTPETLSQYRIGVPRSAAQDTALTAIAPEGTNIMRFDDDAATIQALMSGQVDAVGGNQFYITRIEEGAPGKYENKMPLTALYNGVGTRLGEADWNQSVNAFLAEFMATDEYKGIYNTWMNMDPPQMPAEMEGVPFTIAQ
ncbi:transporter substrate-binding domain-containing protein [Paracoccus sediminis]|uniref:Amino acid ABC transporter substrate-binding protein, PAAT family n=1 Tax=Paracoccus sediminis TaxID=1214787 RepID=A0A238WDW1_9RHOB|nr:transporter substrate-binding domain-containing protein [Paracoccus sediminis]TBN50919.1 transporter substrate-binding domain-containing protein [Paracoccus sediminis]SNR44463.1 amino acid ABC transporter substrate-binding protein, PAAT family [Paracoccus sediminis]